MINIEINKIYLGDNLELLKQLEPNTIHSCVSDFPYNLGFMGRKWDTITNYYDWCYQRALELFRVMKPGGICLIFGGTRTHHRLVCAFEDAGFQIKDEIQWIYGSGFPKSYNISKGFDKKAGAEREIIGKRVHPTLKNIPNVKSSAYHVETLDSDKDMESWDITAPSTDLAKQWDGWGTALKPAQEPIMVCQKPIEKNYCYNVEKYGVGGINIDASRITTNDKLVRPSILRTENIVFGKGLGNGVQTEPKGRFPANLIFDEESASILDKQTGILKSGDNCTRTKVGSFLEHGGLGRVGDTQTTYGDEGGASRFFYCAKATKKDKNENGLIGNTHVTVKPTELIKYLVKLITPKDGICIDICEGSGTHVKAILELNKEGFDFNYIGFENDEESFNIACQREELNK